MPVTSNFIKKETDLACLWQVLLLKKRLWHRCFPANFAKFLRTCLFTEHLRTTASELHLEVPMKRKARTCMRSKLFNLIEKVFVFVTNAFLTSLSRNISLQVLWKTDFLKFRKVRTETYTKESIFTEALI